ncbi:MAG: sulfite exporter TauE/SafE family protein [Fibrobacterales bacterium]
MIAPLLIGIGSAFTHCPGMCLPLNLVVQKTSKSPLSMVLYHTGRVLGYTAIATLLFFMSDSLVSLKNPLYKKIGFSVVVSMFLIFGLWYLNLIPINMEKGLSKLFPAKLQRWLLGKTSHVSKFFLGVCNALLPCPTSYAVFLWAVSVENVFEVIGGTLLFGVATTPAFALLSVPFVKNRVFGQIWFQRALGVFFLGMFAFKIYKFNMMQGVPSCH